MSWGVPKLHARDEALATPDPSRQRSIDQPAMALYQKIQQIYQKNSVGSYYFTIA
jgi:hypothetical protein